MLWRLLINRKEDYKCTNTMIQMNIYHYKAYHAQIFECWIWFDKKPYHMECEMKMSTDKATYCWNELCKDKVW